MKVTLLLVAICGALVGAHAADNCHGTKNAHPLWVGEPVPLRNSTNGDLFTVNNGYMYLLHVRGTPYEMGYAQGELLKTELNTLMPALTTWLDAAIKEALPKLPAALRELIEKYGVPGALDLTWDLTKAHTPAHFVEEMQGLADASGIPFMTIVRMNQIPEVIRASCSMLGAWGPAVQSTTGSLLQLRALDWGYDNPLANYPLLAVYHPNEGNGEEFASLTWPALTGSITAYGKHLGISEKVWLHYNGTKPRDGYPFPFLMRDVAQYDKTIDDALNRMINAKRTCSVFLGVGGRRENQFRAVEYSHDQLYAFNDVNYPYYAPTHPQKDGLVFVDKHTQPSTDPCFGGLLSEAYGSIDAASIMGMTALFETGDMHAAVYDFGANAMYVSVAGASSATNSTILPAYVRQWHKFDMNTLFAHVW